MDLEIDWLIRFIGLLCCVNVLKLLLLCLFCFLQGVQTIRLLRRSS